MARKRGFIKGLGLGALVAGVGALLFAPKSGKDTREDLQANFDDVKQRLTTGLDEIKEASVRVKQDSVKETKDLMKRAEKLKQQLNETALKLTSVKDDAREEVRGQASDLVAEGRALLEELEILGKKIGASAKREVSQASKKVSDTVRQGTEEAEVIAKKAQTVAKTTARKATTTAKRTATKTQKTVKQAASKAAKTATKPAAKRPATRGKK